MGRFRNKSKAVPAVPTAALPDIIFILLFFFIVTTKPRESHPQVRTKLPEATQLTKLDESKVKINILIGSPLEPEKYGTEPVIQFENRIIQLNQLQGAVRQIMADKDKSEDNVIVFIKGESSIKMGIVNDVKKQLRDMNVRNIDYASTKSRPQF